MSSTTNTRPQVPGGTGGFADGDGRRRGAGTRGAKNLRAAETPRQTTLALATYNARTLRTEEKLLELEEELNRIRWSIVGLSEVRREGEYTMVLKSGNLFFSGKAKNSHKVVLGSLSTSLSLITLYKSEVCQIGWRTLYSELPNVFVEGHTGICPDFDAF
jgi:hypothetical protein